MNLSSLFQYISSFSVIIPVIIGVYTKFLLKKTNLAISCVLIVALIVEIINVICSWNGINNMFIFGIYTLIEFIGFILFYKSFFDTFRRSLIHYIMITLFLLITGFESFSINHLIRINYFSDSLEAIIFILYSLTAFYFIMKRMMYDDLLNTPFFWINIAILIYFAGNLFLFMFSNYLQQNDLAQYMAVYNIHSVTNITYYILISIGFWKSAKI